MPYHTTGWRKKYGSMGTTKATRLKELVREIVRFHRKSVLYEVCEESWMFRFVFIILFSRLKSNLTLLDLVKNHLSKILPYFASLDDAICNHFIFD